MKTEFGKKLGDEGVVIIDPATGTGNFVVNLLRRAHKRNLRNFEEFYRERLFANEVMLMPYYIASLNIEHEFFELTGTRPTFRGTLLRRYPRSCSRAPDDDVHREPTPRASNASETPISTSSSATRLTTSANSTKMTTTRIANTMSSPSASARPMPKIPKATNQECKLSDAYVKFFPLGEPISLDDRDGIVCYVSNNGFVDRIRL